MLFVVCAGCDPFVNVDWLRGVERQQREDDEQEVDHQLAATFGAGSCGVHGVVSVPQRSSGLPRKSNWRAGARGTCAGTRSFDRACGGSIEP
jgi:hypothetical protein